MARRIRVIGVGAGNPDHMTIEAINALNTCDVLFVPTKGEEKIFLADLRHAICTRFISGTLPRVIDYSVPDRHRGGDYSLTVHEWHGAIADIYEQLLCDQVEETDTVGLLIWGDPMLYDSTIRIIEHVRERGRVAFDYDVIAGISSLQALCASHRIPLNRIGGAITITTGRRLSQSWPDEVFDVAVMLDGVGAYQSIDDPHAEIYWGAYLGTPMEITMSGRVKEIASEISRLREAARAEHGWIMDTYLLRRPWEDSCESDVAS
ncbi:precorrin-6A synthase [Agrobacterium vitis]|nr:precorrin-6A synthase [Agrobacterium vitis]MBE1440456.1 precorrin-6A synthase [Agrobacterium vitis]